MGDRVLIQAVSRGEFGPVVYGHWSGEAAPGIVAATVKQMGERTSDVPYTTARLIQNVLKSRDDERGALSVGCWNAQGRLTAEDSHGDAGVVLLDCDTMRCECLGGYLEVNAEGMPCVPASY